MCLRRPPGRYRSVEFRWSERLFTTSAGASGWCSRIPTISCSCRRSLRTSHSARRTSGCAVRSSPPGWRAALAVVSLTEHADRSPTHLSAGQRRRAALATVLACEPDILVLDEPSANLDPVARRELAETLSGLDATMLIVTHDLPYAAQLCDRAVIMDGGVIVADGAIADILSDSELLAAHRLELPWGFSVSRQVIPRVTVPYVPARRRTPRVRPSRSCLPRWPSRRSSTSAGRGVRSDRTTDRSHVANSRRHRFDLSSNPAPDAETCGPRAPRRLRRRTSNIRWPAAEQCCATNCGKTLSVTPFPVPIEAMSRGTTAASAGSRDRLRRAPRRSRRCRRAHRLSMSRAIAGKPARSATRTWRSAWLGRLETRTWRGRARPGRPARRWSPTVSRPRRHAGRRPR